MVYIESQFMAFVRICQAEKMNSECDIYKILEVDELIHEQMGPELGAEFLAVTKRQGQFEHIFRRINDPKFSHHLVKLAAHTKIPTFRLDGPYATCDAAKAVMDLISNGTLNLPFQTNSDTITPSMVRNKKCRQKLPIFCDHPEHVGICRIKTTDASRV
eukprot:CAMPEP_0114491350 /NCGR_PEP_ID=MMETSP0109-20121206/2954_1 /TAXON_ID=29199 /ORGANISM="Chlorarachnion reptans, Strain CCCM449" /LENGTH=158 /DNA_ID=CAMNT_0001668079 /DNA_START=174 /DNA_END=650 /DNA_ORIENTATION=+